MREIRTEIEIEAPAARVWQVLTDFAAFPEWNPFMTTAEGDLVEGRRIRVALRSPGHRPMEFRPTLLSVEPERSFRWLGRLGVPGVFDGEHTHTLEPLGPGRTRYVQSERFRGVLVPFVGAMLKDTTRGFEEMNRALKARAEAA